MLENLQLMFNNIMNKNKGDVWSWKRRLNGSDQSKVTLHTVRLFVGGLNYT